MATKHKAAHGKPVAKAAAKPEPVAPKKAEPPEAKPLITPAKPEEPVKIEPMTSEELYRRQNQYRGG